jgi:hypothetical protein
MGDCPPRAGAELARARWRGTSPEERRAATAKPRAGWLETFERIVDPDERLAPEERARLAAEARRAHMAELSKRGVAARRLKRLAEIRRLGVTVEQRLCVHKWPGVLNSGSTCRRCGLAYLEYVEVLGGAA